jgi:hypothetical protein
LTGGEIVMRRFAIYILLLILAVSAKAQFDTAIVHATQVVSAMGADQLALMPREAMAAVGANLAVMVDGGCLAGGAGCTTL